MRGMGWVVLAGLAAACAESEPTATGGDPFGDLLADVNPNAAGLVRYDLILTPEQEVPPANSIAYGVMRIAITRNDVLEAGIRIFNPGCETIVAGHIHDAPPDSTGPVKVPLFSGSITPKRETLRARVQLTPALADSLREVPGDFYVNYHSTLTPTGFIRAQLGTDYPDPTPPAVPSGPCT